ncbi:MAG: phosphotransferase family protein [Antricoccus sp.]
MTVRRGVEADMSEQSLGNRAESAKSSTPGIEIGKTTAWLADHVQDLQPPLQFDLIAGGRSNLTYKVTDVAGRSWALRRPPTGMVLQTAHDMSREWTFISALNGTDVPVATPAAYCADHEVTGADFYVMDFTEGKVLGDPASADGLTDEVKVQIAHSTVQTMINMHNIDPDAVGLTALRRPGNYIERQLRRWNRQLHDSAITDFTVLDEVHRRLSADVPDAPSKIAHGDFRPGNLAYDPAGNAVAVFDWELATIGDPLADLSWLLTSWVLPTDDFPGVTDGPTLAGGFPPREQLADQYAAGTGADLSRLAYYMAFSRWRAACIGAGVYSRYIAGVMGEIPKNIDERQTHVHELAAAALAGLS